MTAQTSKSTARVYVRALSIKKRKRGCFFARSGVMYTGLIHGHRTSVR